LNKCCPFCNKEIGGSSHIYKCKQKLINLTKEDIKFQYIQKNCNHEITKDLIEDLYINQQYSLPDFKEKFEFDFKTTQFLITYFGFNIRTISEAHKTEKTINRTKETLMQKYGVDNSYQIPKIKEKLKNINLEKYGVDNIFKSKEFRQWLHNYMMKTYGKGSLSGSSVFWKSKWDNMTSEEKKQRCKKWVQGSIDWYNNLNEEERIIYNQKRSHGIVKASSSKLEARLFQMFHEMGIDILSQFWINQTSYDFKIKKTKLLIEVQGDYWHANKNKYSENDILNFPNEKVTAKSIWEKDKRKKKNAEKYGYKIIYIWESEMNNMTDDDLKQWILIQLENITNGNEDKIN